MSCTLFGQWLQLCNSRRFVEGATISLGVTDAGNNKIIYPMAPRMLVLRTKLCSPTSTGATEPIYQVEQNFWTD